MKVSMGLKAADKKLSKNESISFLFFQLMERWTAIYLRENERMEKEGKSEEAKLQLAMKFTSFSLRVNDDFNRFHGCFDVVSASKRFQRIFTFSET